VRTIDALPIANAAPLVDEAQRQRLLGNSLIVLGVLVNAVVLATLFAAMFGAVDRDVVPVALPGIAVGAAVTAWGNRLRRRASN
jgi:hypothetical protein